MERQAELVQHFVNGVESGRGPEAVQLIVDSFYISADLLGYGEWLQGTNENGEEMTHAVREEQRSDDPCCRGHEGEELSDKFSKTLNTPLSEPSNVKMDSGASDVVDKVVIASKTPAEVAESIIEELKSGGAEDGR
eukprot:Gb_27312 [translate_table: standard]